MTHIPLIIFLFVLGACVGSFLNVVVWRLPRGESLVTPPSHCPKCQHHLAWYDNLPVVGWIFLGGKCRYCHQLISFRYPLIETITGVLFAAYYVFFFMVHLGPCVSTVDPDGEVVRSLQLGDFADQWPIYGLYMFLISGLLASSLIDAELFIIPVEIPWLIAIVAFVVHGIVDWPSLPGALNLSPAAAALGLGASVGLLISILLWAIGRMPTSFPQGEPMLEVDREALAAEIERARRQGQPSPPLPPAYTKSQIRAEMGKEMLFLLPPLFFGIVWVVLYMRVGAIGRMWQVACSYHWVTGLLGSLLGAMVGAFVVWVTRILGTLGFGRVAMGLGDVHLMFGVGAVVGAGAVTVAFFIAPFFGILIAIYMLLTGTRRELPYGPYLSLATAFTLLFYCPIANYLRPGVQGLIMILQQVFGGA